MMKTVGDTMISIMRLTSDCSQLRIMIEGF